MGFMYCLAKVFVPHKPFFAFFTFIISRIFCLIGQHKVVHDFEVAGLFMYLILKSEHAFVFRPLL